MNEQATNEQALPTRITTATVSVTLSHNSNYFKVELGIENESGLSLDEINDYRLKAHDLVNTAIEDHQISLRQEPQFTKTTFKPAKQVINVNNVHNDDGSEIGVKDNAEVSEIAKLPLYTKHKNA